MNVFTILLIHNDPDELHRIQQLLTASTRVQFDVTGVDRLPAAQDYLKQRTPDVILVGVGGASYEVEVLSQIQADAPTVPLVALIGTNDEWFGTKAIEGGAQDFLLPDEVTTRWLVRALTCAIERRQIQRRLVERARFEATLHDEEATFRRLAEASSIGQFIADIQGTVHYANPALLNLLEYTQEDVRSGTVCWDQMFPGQPPLLDAIALREIVTTGTCAPHEKEYLLKDGRRLLFLVSGAVLHQGPMGNVIIAVSLTDLTLLKRAEEALGDSEARFRVLAETMPNSLFTALASGEIDYLNQQFYDYTGLPPGEGQGQGWLRAVHDEDVDILKAAWARAVHEGAALEIEYRLRAADGKYHWYVMRAHPVRRLSGAISHWVGTSTDIHEFKQATSVLQESENRLRRVLENMPVMLEAMDEKGMIIVWNTECERVTGYRADEIIGNPQAFELLYPNRAYRESLIAERARRGNNYREWEWTITCKDGSTRLVAWSSVADVLSIPGWKTWGIGVDVTDRTKAQAAEREQRLLAEALRDTANALTGVFDLPKILELILNSIEKVVPHDTANIMLIENGIAHVVSVRGYENRPALREQELNFRAPVNEIAAFRHILETGQPFVRADVPASPIEIQLTGPDRLRSFVGLPIRLHDEVIGFLNIASTQLDFFSAQHVERLQAFAEQASVAIQSAHLHEQAQALVALQERERLARDLHDAVSQSLFSASLIAESLPRISSKTPDRLEQHLQHLNRLIRGSLAEMRVLLLELRPASLLKGNLPEQFVHLAEAVQSRTQIAIQIDADPVQLPPDVKVVFYRIAQEALNNVAKHAQASKATVQLKDGAGQVTLTVVDDGCGFDTAAVSSTSLGLSIMRERAETIGAALTISTESGRGTTVELVWPRA